PHPAPERLARAADLCSNRLDGRPLRRVFALVLEHQPNRPLPHLRGVLLCLSHAPNLSRVGASGKPGGSICPVVTSCGAAHRRPALPFPDRGQRRPRESTELSRARPCLIAAARQDLECLSKPPLEEAQADEGTAE